MCKKRTVSTVKINFCHKYYPGAKDATNSNEFFR